MKPDEKLEVDENQEANKSRKGDCVERFIEMGLSGGLIEKVLLGNRQ